MPYLLLLIITIVTIFYAPHYWAQHIFKRYSKKIDRIPGTGGELARHLLDKFDMSNVSVEITDKGDHYDPADKMVRLSKNNFNDNSLTAVAVAAHEVGHAIQDNRNEASLQLRTRLVGLATTIQKSGSVAFMLLPVVAGLTRAPSLMVLLVALTILSMLSAVVIHLVTLPVEIDASFNKALPILKQGYIEPRDEKAIARILKAAAYTYVAASLASVFNIWRWLMMFRR